jgi:hypothetical protein
MGAAAPCVRVANISQQMCQRAREDLQLTPLIAASVGETRGVRPDRGAAGLLSLNATARDESSDSKWLRFVATASIDVDPLKIA